MMSEMEKREISEIPVEERSYEQWLSLKKQVLVLACGPINKNPTGTKATLARVLYEHYHPPIAEPVDIPGNENPVNENVEAEDDDNISLDYNLSTLAPFKHFEKIKLFSRVCSSSMFSLQPLNLHSVPNYGKKNLS